MVGSSRKTISGSLTSARATPSRCRWPPGQDAGLRIAPLAKVERLDQLGRRPRPSVETPEEVEHLGDRELRVEGRGLEAHADAWLERVGATGDVDAQHADLAIIGCPKPLEDLDGRRLARPVRSEQPEDLAPGDVEVDAIDSLDIAVALGQATDADDGFGRSRDGHDREWWQSEINTRCRSSQRVGQSFFRKYAAIGGVVAHRLVQPPGIGPMVARGHLDECGTELRCDPLRLGHEAAADAAFPRTRIDHEGQDPQDPVVVLEAR